MSGVRRDVLVNPIGCLLKAFFFEAVVHVDSLCKWMQLGVVECAAAYTGAKDVISVFNYQPVRVVLKSLEVARIERDCS